MYEDFDFELPGIDAGIREFLNGPRPNVWQAEIDKRRTVDVQATVIPETILLTTTKESICMSNTIQELAIAAHRFGKNSKGVITASEANARANVTNTIVTHHDRIGNVVFFSDDRMFGGEVLEGFVPMTSAVPQTVTPREGLEDGIIVTAEQVKRIFYKHARLITTIDELVEYIDQRKEFKRQWREDICAESDAAAAYDAKWHAENKVQG